jgi:hypothetical protein
MNVALRWFLGILGLLLLAVTPYLWLYGWHGLAWIAIPLLAVWAVWLMTEYLKWAKTLGKK